MKPEILGFIRHALTTFGGSAVTAGYLGQDELTALVGGLVTLVGVVWSLFDKKKA